MRFIFMDEAGTSQHEPVTVVVGIIANADKHIMSAERLILEAIGSVPPKFSKDFVFHATSVFGDRKYHDHWGLTDRIRFLKFMMSIPRRIGMAVSISAIWRNSPGSEEAKKLELSKSQFDHILAFGNCIAIADRNIRNHAGAREIGTVVAEDVPEMRRYLRDTVKVYKNNPIIVGPDYRRKTFSDKLEGHDTQNGDLRVTRIRDAIHFVEKDSELLVQIADACAFGIRRFLSGQKFGRDFAEAIVGGPHPSLNDFGSPSGNQCWWFKESEV